MDGELLIQFDSYESEVNVPGIRDAMGLWRDQYVRDITLKNGVKVGRWKRFVILPAKMGQKV